MEQPPLPTEQRKFRPLVERTWAGTELSLPRGATSMLGAAQCHGFGGGYRQSVPPSAMPMLGACKSLLPEQSKQRHAKNARLSNLMDLLLRNFFFGRQKKLTRIVFRISIMGIFRIHL